MSRAAMLGSLSAALIGGAGLAGPGRADEITPPRVGHASHFTCSGTMQHDVGYEVAALDGGIITYRINADGVHRTLIMPLWFLGTSLYQKDFGDKFGETSMSGDLASFDGLKNLAVGREFTGTVVQHLSPSQSIEWRYKITVIDKRTIQDPTLGQIVAFVISEGRDSGNRSSRRTSLVSPALGEMVSSEYSDSAGNHRDCHIASMTR